MKRKKHNRRRRSGLSESGKTSTRRRRRHSGMFDGMLSGSNLKTSLINTGLGMAGGAGASVGYKMIQGLKFGTIGNMLAGAGIGFIASSLGAPKMGIGFAGGVTALALQAGLSEDESNTNFEEGEIYQTESGDYVKMLSDGNVEYLSEEEVEALNDGNEVYPDYSTMNAFQQ